MISSTYRLTRLRLHKIVTLAYHDTVQMLIYFVTSRTLRRVPRVVRGFSTLCPGRVFFELGMKIDVYVGIEIARIDKYDFS